MKKLMSIFLVLAMLLTLAPMNIMAADDNATAFSDVKDADYYAQAAEALAQLDILSGYADGTFRAEKTITRAEMAAIVCRMLSKESDAQNAKGETAFDDVKSDHWASGYINIASKEGIISGDGNGKFRPEDEVKYEEAIKMIVCALGYDADVTADAEDWSKGYLEVASKKGISDNLKGTKGKASTRGDIAVMSFNGLLVDVAAPTASLKAGNYTGTKRVTLETATEGAEIYYTIDGSAPTVKSTKYTGAISLTKTCTLKAITVKDGVLASDVLNVDYTITRQSGGSSDPSKYTVSFDLNYKGATGAPASQTMSRGGKVTMPENPEREGYAFAGWYVDSSFTEMFVFESTTINSNTTIYARWVDKLDTTDTDGDGLTDPFEEYHGTDKEKEDTDGDGLNDYVEVMSFEYNPLAVDSDGNGISDGDEDVDGDGLNNKEEIALGTNPFSQDSDKDGLTDADEINIYNTDPTKEDTDGDGASDSEEIELGTDSLVTQTTFEVTKTAQTEDSVEASVDIELSGEQIETLSIEKVESNVLFPEDMPGYLGSAYEFKVKGEFDSATIRFEFDESLVGNPDVEPTIYYFNEETQQLEELETTINGNVATATVSHFSKYILINRKVYQESFTWQDVWDSDKIYTSAEIVLAIDDSGSLGGIYGYSEETGHFNGGNDPEHLRFEAARNFVDASNKNTKISIVKFDGEVDVMADSVICDDEGKETLKDILKFTPMPWEDRFENIPGVFDSYGQTAMYEAVDEAFNHLSVSAEGGDSVLRAIVIFNDGEADDKEMHDAVLERANDLGVKIHAIGLGYNSEYFNYFLKPLATNTGGYFYLASNAEHLASIYEDIGQKIDIETDSDIDGIPDYYEDNMIMFNGVKLVLDKNNPDSDGDGILDGEEVTLEYKYNDDNTKVIVTGKLSSNPLYQDSDSDGLIDANDIWPFIATSEYITEDEMDMFENDKMAPMAYTYMMHLTYKYYLNQDDPAEVNMIHRQLDEFRYNEYLYSNGYIIVHPDGHSVNVDQGIAYMPTMISGEPTKEQHYFRNELNLDYTWSEYETLKANLPADMQWDGTVDASYHQNYTVNDLPNRKYVSACGHFELIYNGANELLNASNNPHDMGTYNYASPSAHPILHAWKDVKPYGAIWTKWGNVPDHCNPLYE